MRTEYGESIGLSLGLLVGVRNRGGDVGADLKDVGGGEFQGEQTRYDSEQKKTM